MFIFDLQILSKIGIKTISYDKLKHKFRISPDRFRLTKIIIFSLTILGIALNGVVSIIGGVLDRFLIMFAAVIVGVFVPSWAAVYPFLIDSKAFVTLLNMLIEQWNTYCYESGKYYLISSKSLKFPKVFKV